MRAILLDTHAIIWYFLKSPKLSNTALTANGVLRFRETIEREGIEFTDEDFAY